MSVDAATMAVRAADIVQRVERGLTQGSPTSNRVYIAGAEIDLDVDASIADALLTPFAHRASAARSAADLHIFAAASADALPELETLPDTGVVAQDGSSILHLQRESAIVLDRAASTIHALLRNARNLPSWHRAKPFQAALSIFFSDRGIHFLHAGLVSLRGNGVLLAGAGGSGKSTLSVAALLSGLDFLGDDCVAVRGTLGYSVFASSCIERTHLRQFALPRTIETADGDKEVLPLAHWFAERMAGSTAIRAIVLPRITHTSTISVHPASPKDALLALAPSSILKRAVPAANALACMTRLAREVPAYILEMGPIADAGHRIAELLENTEKGSA